MKEDFFAGISNKALKVASWAVISEAGKIVLKIWYWNFEFVSNFDIRISDLYAIRYTHDAILQIVFFDFSVECSFAEAFLLRIHRNASGHRTPPGNYIFFFSFFNLRFSFGLSRAFFCCSLLPLSFFPLSPISVSPCLKMPCIS